MLGAAGMIALSACDSSPSAPQVASVRVESPSTVVLVGESIQLTAVALDAAGNPIPGLPVTWSSSATQILQVSGAGQATGVNVGSALARAEIAGVVGSRSIQVAVPPVASIVVVPSPVEVPRASQAQLAVTLFDASGNELTGRTITYQSANPSIASVSSGGLVGALQVGTTQITVRSGDASTVVPVTVLAGDEPVIESISPAVVGEDMLIEIFGRQFSAVPSSNIVRIGGAAASVLEASPTRLLVRTPATICMPSGSVPVVVEVAGDTSPLFEAPFEGGNGVSLTTGEFRLLTGDEAGCLRLAGTTGASSFLIGVQSATGNENLVTPIAVTGTRGQSQGSASSTTDASGDVAWTDWSAGIPASRPRSVSFSDVVRSPAAATRGAPDLLRRHHDAEESLRAREREIMAPHLASGAPQRAMQRTLAQSGAGVAAGVTSAAKVPATVQPGDTLTINIPDIRPNQNFCTTGIPVDVVVRRIGPGSIWLDDVLNPLPGLSAEDYAELGAQFDQETLPRLQTHFGEPTDLDGNDRIVIVISQQVNRFGGVLGFVVSTDFAPAAPGGCPASNEGEFYYSITPDPDGQIPVTSNPVRIDVEEFRSLTPRLAAHETTHIIQFGRRIASGASAFGTIWELEGQAVLAEEVVGLDAVGLGPRQNLGAAVAFNTSETSPVYWFENAFVDLLVYYGFQSSTSRANGAPAGCSWLGRGDVSGPCNYGRLPYGVSWSFLRWLSDHYGDQFAGGEAEMHRRLVEASVAGFPAIEQVVGESRSPLLAYWAASLYTDGRLPPGADARLSFPSWNLRSIDSFVWPTAHLQPVNVTFNGFTATAAVAAGSSHYLRLSGPAQPSFAIRTLTQAGTPLPAHMQVWVVRLE